MSLKINSGLTTSAPHKEIEDIRTAANGGYALGDDRFKEEIEGNLKKKAKPGRSGRPATTEQLRGER